MTCDTPIPPTDPAPQTILEGIDISGNNGNIDAQRVVGEGGKSFVVIKCTEGVNWVDPHYDSNLKRFQLAKIPCITIYHYLRLRQGRPQDSDVQIAQFFDKYRLLQDASQTECPRAWCDIELNENFQAELLHAFNTHDVIAIAKMQNDWRDCISKALDKWNDLSQLSGLKQLAIYTDDGEWASLGGYKITEANAYPLVLANTNGSTHPKIPTPWKDKYIHQYAADITTIGTCPGVFGHCDLDRFVGTIDELRVR